jgi:O-antigen/teichoic acid export membrane protein
VTRRVPGPGGAPGASLAWSGLLLAVTTTLANLCGYGFTLVVSRALGPGEFGAIGALLNLTLIAAVPALALQLVAARVTARACCADRPDRALRRAAARLGRVALGIGAALAVVIVAGAAPLAAFLHLDGQAPAIFAAGVAVAGTGAALGQGVLQGCERFPALSLVYLVSGGSRLAAGALAALAGGGQTGVMAATFGAAVLTAAVSTGLALPALPGLTLPALPGVTVRAAARVAVRAAGHDGATAGHDGATAGSDERPGREVLGSTISMAGLFLLGNLDVLLARHYLPRDVSGLYAVGSLFGKAAFWGPQFFATLLYPGMATPHRRRTAVVRGLAFTTGTGLVAVGTCAAVARPALRALFGPVYLPLAPQLWIFAALGAVLAVVQVLVYAHLAAGVVRWGAATCGVAAGVWALVAWRLHGSVTDVAGTVLTGACLLAVLGTATALPRLPARAPAVTPVRDAA